MKNDPLKASVLSVKMIPNVDDDMKKELNLPDDHRSIGMITTDCDDVGYTALDEATKKQRYLLYMPSPSTVVRPMQIRNWLANLSESFLVRHRLKLKVVSTQ